MAVALCLLLVVATSPSSVFAAEIPSDDEQDVLIRSTLMTFNDANMTGNYSVFLAKASKEFQGQFTVDKMAAAFESFRAKGLFFESVATEDYDSYEKAKIEADGQLVLAGVFKADGMQVKYVLKFFQNNKVWKVSGITVNANKP
jgi:hypothetical protein